jgi:hypothetical protein
MWRWAGNGPGSATRFAAALGPKRQGDLFELLTKYYLLLKREYRTKLSDVWLLEEVPQKVRAALKLPGPD